MYAWHCWGTWTGNQGPLYRFLASKHCAHLASSNLICSPHMNCIMQFKWLNCCISCQGKCDGFMLVMLAKKSFINHADMVWMEHMYWWDTCGSPCEYMKHNSYGISICGLTCTFSTLVNYALTMKQLEKYSVLIKLLVLVDKVQVICSTSLTLLVLFIWRSYLVTNLHR